MLNKPIPLYMVTGAAFHVAADLPGERKLPKAGELPLWSDGLKMLRAAEKSGGDYVLRASIPYCVSERVGIALAWMSAITAYPLFAQVAELIGRQLILYGETTTTTIHRRTAELMGENDSTKRKTAAAINTMVNWGVIAKTDRTITIGHKKIYLDDEGLTGLMIEAICRYKGALSLYDLDHSPLFFAVNMTASPVMAARNNSNLRVHYGYSFQPIAIFEQSNRHA